ncbi:DinB family protein [Pirellulaceae bacterium SH467]
MQHEEPYFQKYLNRVVVGAEPVEQLRSQGTGFVRWAERVESASTTVLHTPYTWTVRQVLHHITDTERVFAFRTLWFARGASEPLPSFDEHEFVRRSHANEIDWPQLVDEFQTVRAASVSLFANLSPEDWKRSGRAAGYEMDVSMLCGMIFGHLDHHFEILQRRIRS